MIAYNTNIERGLDVKDMDADGLMIEVEEGRVWVSHEQLDEIHKLSVFVRSINDAHADD